MKRFEQINHVNLMSTATDPVSLDVHEPIIDDSQLDKILTLEELQDYLFDEYMKQNLMDDFFNAASVHLDDDQVDEMQKVMSEHSDKEIIAALSLPYELRESMFQRFGGLFDHGHDVKEVTKNFIQAHSKHGFGVGYHTSPLDIRPDERGQWEIRGTEPDHRDNDVAMAYYSTQYRHLFRKKNPKFIYLVRTDPQSHKTDGNWSRAASLSVSARVPIQDVVNFVENTANTKVAGSNETATG